MEGLLGWTTPFIWTMPGLLLAAFPVPFPAGLPADGLLVAALPLAAFLRDIFSRLPNYLNESVLKKTKISPESVCARWVQGWKVAGEENFNSQIYFFSFFFSPAPWTHVPRHLSTQSRGEIVPMCKNALASVVVQPLPAPSDSLLFPGQQPQHCAL